MLETFGNHKDAVYKAYRYLEKLGICFDTHPRHKLTFTLGEETKVFSHFFIMWKRSVRGFE